MRKTCSKCKLELDITFFYKESRVRSGLCSQCKLCQSLRSKTDGYKKWKKEYMKKYFKSVDKRDKKNNSQKKYHQTSLVYKKWKIENRKERMMNDIQFKLARVLRRRLHNVLRRNQKSGSAVRDLGCTISELKTHIESQFKLGMTWENHGQFGWHIDHEVPLSLFDLTNREQLLHAVHYTNLQPMWAKENIVKNNHLVLTTV